MLLFFVSFIDRATIGFAALAMNKNLGLSPSVFGFGAGIFLLGYLLFEVPPNLTLGKGILLSRFRAAVYLEKASERRSLRQVKITQQ
jgi:hypothetical protein